MSFFLKLKATLRKYLWVPAVQKSIDDAVRAQNKALGDGLLEQEMNFAIIQATSRNEITKAMLAEKKSLNDALSAQEIDLAVIQATSRAQTKSLNDALSAQEIDFAVIQATSRNEITKFGSMLRELQDSISASNAKFDQEHIRRENVEEQMISTITMLAFKINRLENTADQRIGLIGDLRE